MPSYCCAFGCQNKYFFKLNDSPSLPDDEALATAPVVFKLPAFDTRGSYLQACSGFDQAVSL